MKELISHIEFLIQQHEYVIIPNMGGFVLNKVHAHVCESGCVTPPALSVGFNAELKFNDGLLAESYMQKSSISYDVALKKIDEDIKQLRLELVAGKEVPFGNLGMLNLVDGHIVYTSSPQHFIHPSVWGYSNVELKRLGDIDLLVGKSHEKRLVMRRVFAGVASTVAALVLWGMSASVNDNLFRTMQHSGFFVNKADHVANKIISKPLVSVERELILDAYVSSIKISDSIAASIVSEPVVAITDGKNAAPKPPKVTWTKEKRYFIVVGGDVNKNIANRMLKKIKAQGFENAALVESPDRYRIYVEVFKDKATANAFLNRFRGKNLTYKDAWLFTKAILVKS